MAAKTLTEARDALETALDGVTGLTLTHPEVPDSITAPAAVVQPAPGDFLNMDPSMDDTVDYQLYVTLYVQRQKPEEGQRQLDALLGPSVPRDCAPRSSTNDASGVTSDLSTPS